MQKKAWLPIKIISLLVAFLAFPRIASAYYTKMPASVVVGQPDFNTVLDGPARNILGNSTSKTVRGLFVDSEGRLIVSDAFNHRVLIWNSVPTENGAPADLVLGQPDFVTNTTNYGGRSAQSFNRPTGVYSDGQRLFVFDSGNSRILIWNTFPTENRQAADVVVGQSDMTSAVSACDAEHLYTHTNRPGIVWVHNEKLLASTGSVGSAGNGRVLIWNSIPTTNGEAADIVLGKPDMNDCTAISPPNQKSLGSPRGLQVDAQGRLFVADFVNNKRILIWNSIPTSNYAPADVVVGQADFESVVAQTTAYNLDAHDIYSNGEKLFVADTNNRRVLIFNSIPSTNGVSADVVLGQPDFMTNTVNNGGLSASSTAYTQMVFEYNGKLLVSDGNGRILIFEDYEATSTPGFTVNYPPEGSGEKMRLSGNIVMGEYGRFDLRSPEVSINNQGFGPLTNFSKRQHSDHETITEFYHDFEPWAGVAPRDQWTEGNGFTAHFRATSYQSRIETQEAFLFWPFTLDSVSTEGAVPTFAFHIPSKNVEHIKSNLDRFEVYIGKDGNFTQYLKRVPVSLVGEDGRVVVSANSEGVLTAQATFTPGEYEVKVRAFDKWGNHFDTNAVPLTLTQALVSVESTPLFSGFWFPLQINRATGVNTGIISSFRPESVRTSYTTTTLTPTFTGIAFADSLITMTVVNNQNPDEAKSFTTTTGPASTWSLTPTLYPDSTVSITAQKAGLSTQIPPFGVRLFNPQ